MSSLSKLIFKNKGLQIRLKSFIYYHLDNNNHNSNKNNSNTFNLYSASAFIKYSNMYGLIKSTENSFYKGRYQYIF